jgi:hypothetical protein
MTATAEQKRMTASDTQERSNGDCPYYGLI